MPPRGKSPPPPHLPFSTDCRCHMCRSSKGYPAPVAVELMDNVQWHRAGWSARRQRYNGPEPVPHPQADAGPTLDRVPRQYNGAVYLRPVECTFMHTRVAQHTHKTTLLRSSLPNRDTNYGALFTEMDVRLRNMHRTLATVRARSSAVVTEHLSAASHQGIQAPGQQAALVATGPSGGQAAASGQQATLDAAGPSDGQQQQALGPLQLGDGWGRGQWEGAQAAGPVGVAGGLMPGSWSAGQAGQDLDGAGPAAAGDAMEAAAAAPSGGWGGSAAGAEPPLGEEGGRGAGVDTATLRRAVNQSLDSQLDFFTDCMARWCLQECSCKCPSCACICQRSHATLANRAWGLH